MARFRSLSSKYASRPYRDYRSTCDNCENCTKKCIASKQINPALCPRVCQLCSQFCSNNSKKSNL